jgi:hypothetical protein
MDAVLNLGQRVSHQVQQRWQQPDRGYERER